MLAINGPARNMNTGGLAPSTHSLISHFTNHGAGTPPTSSLSPTRNHSPSRQADSDFLNGSGRLTTWVSGSNVGGWRSPSANDSATGPSASRAASESISRTDSPSKSPNASSASTSSKPSASNRLNSRSRTLL